MAPIRSSRRKNQQQQQPAARRPDPQPSQQGQEIVAPQPQETTEPPLHQLPDRDQLPEEYSDVIDSNGVIRTETLERRLPPALLHTADSSDANLRSMLQRIPPPREITMSHIHREYRQMIASSYKPLHPQLYAMDNPDAFFVPSFLQAINSKSTKSFSNIIYEPLPGVYAFSMLQPTLCEMLMAEVRNFVDWAHAGKKRIVMPTTIDKFGVTISDLGMQGMLDDLMKKFISPISTVLFPEVGGGSLDSQHSFVMSYGGDDKDSGRGLHVDECEITLNVCLGKQCNGGDVFFHGRRCINHINSHMKGEAVYQYNEQVPGQALMYHGCHRRHILPTRSGSRVNMFMWCRSSTYKKKMECMNHFPDWCAKCQSKNVTNPGHITAATLTGEPETNTSKGNQGDQVQGNEEAVKPRRSNRLRKPSVKINSNGWTR